MYIDREREREIDIDGYIERETEDGGGSSAHARRKLRPGESIYRCIEIDRYRWIYIERD